MFLSRLSVVEMRQIKGAPGLELLPSEKDPRKLRWQRVAPEQKAPQRARQVNTEDEETQRYNKLREFLREAGKKTRRMRLQLRDAGVPKEDAQRIAFDYLIKRLTAFFGEETQTYPLPDYPVYPEELKRKRPSQKPIEPVNPGYTIEVVGGTGDETDAAKEFVGNLLGALREIHPLPKGRLKIVVAVPTRYKGIKGFNQWMRKFNLRPSEASGIYVHLNYLIILRGFNPIIHEFGHFLDDFFSYISQTERYVETARNAGVGLSSAYRELRKALDDWFYEHGRDFINPHLDRCGLSLEGVTDHRTRRQILTIRDFYKSWFLDNRELLAYTYMQYVIWKLAELGRTDLAQFWLEASRKGFTPLFPADVFKPVKDAYDKFFNRVREIMSDEDVLKWFQQALWVKF
jgi:hypothetical protein